MLAVQLTVAIVSSKFLSCRRSFAVQVFEEVCMHLGLLKFAYNQRIV
jgi:hypothetical protein